MTMVIAASVGAGKTTQLIKLAAEAEARGEVCYIVVHNHQEAWRVRQHASKLGLSIGFPLTYEEFVTNAWARSVHHIYIDNVLDLLQYIAGPTRVEAVTLTTRSEVLFDGRLV